VAQTLSKVDAESVDGLHVKLQAVVQQQARHARSVEECVKAITQDQVRVAQSGFVLGKGPSSIGQGYVRAWFWTWC
jgi:hypothetical protein